MAADLGPHGSNEHDPPDGPVTSAGNNEGGDNYQGGGQSTSAANHTHSVQLTIDPADQRPPYREVIIAQLRAAGCP